MYIFARWTWRGSKLLRHVVQLAAFTFAWYTALSRVSDYKHHWSDVFAGSLQGTIVAVLIVSKQRLKAQYTFEKYFTFRIFNFFEQLIFLGDIP